MPPKTKTINGEKCYYNPANHHYVRPKKRGRGLIICDKPKNRNKNN